MRHLDQPGRLFTTARAAVVGYVDAIGVMVSGGFFVSYMSGNTTRLAVSLLEGAPFVALAFGLIGAFVAGVTTGALLGDLAPTRRGAVVLAYVALLLAIAAMVASLDWDHPAAFALAVAIGAQNAVLVKDDEAIGDGLASLTGVLVDLGESITAAALGDRQARWTGHLLLWCAIIAGAAVGALVYSRFGPVAIWLAAGVTAILATAEGHSARE